MDPESTLHLLETASDPHEADYAFYDLVEWLNRGGFHPDMLTDRLRTVAERYRDASRSLTQPAYVIQGSRELSYKITAYLDTLARIA